MVNQKEKIEKFTKDDKNRKMLKCSFTGCYFTTSATLKKCKARKQIKQDEEKNKKEEKGLLETEEEHTSDVVGADLADVDDRSVDGP